MKNNLLKKIFSSGLQAIGVQVLGLLFFYIVSLYMSKNDLGIVNWATATSVIITTLLSFGMEQVVFRRIAASQRSDWAAAAYLLHAFIGSLMAFGVLYILSFLLKKDSIEYLPWFFISQVFIYMGTPLKHFLNAKQRFTPYGIIAIVSNSLKILMALLFLKNGNLNITTVWVTLAVCGLIEIIALLLFVTRYAAFRFTFRFSAYKKLLKESLPQYVSVIFDSSLSRLDWFLIGIIGTNAMTADYGVAYKAFEMGRLPITIIAPVILARFAAVLGGNSTLDEHKKQLIGTIFRIEYFFAALIPLIANLLWVPALDIVYNGKYGDGNAMEFLILSINIPLLFAVNLLWTICFTGKSYRKIAGITISSAVVNLVLNLIFIPQWGGVGAAMAFLLTTVLQLAGYYRLVRKEFFSMPLHTAFTCIAVAGVAYFISISVSAKVWLQIPLSVTIYIVGCLLLRQVRLSDRETLKLFFRK